MCEACEDQINDIDFWDNLFVAQGGVLSEQRLIQIAQEKIFVLQNCIGKQWRSCLLRWLGRFIVFIIPSAIMLYFGFQWLDSWGIIFTLFIMPQIFYILISLYESTESEVPGFFTVMERTSLDRKLIQRLKKQIDDIQRQAAAGGSGGHGRARRGSSQPGSQQNPALVDAYALLGLPSNVSDSSLRKRYRELLHDLHPDALSGAAVNPTLSALAEEQVKKLNAAYQLIVESRRQGKR